ncbi:hypothetical protein KJ586_03285 [Patescibacteria group bacterium]|nr:hypothetical protein [Patescibacteria group bacterium]
MKYFKNNLGNLFFSSAVIFFAAVIFLPAVYILIYFFKAETFVTEEIVKSIILSFEIGLIVTFIDLIFGLPLAWSLVRSKSKFIKWLDSLIDLSLVMPTAALGFSVYLYWGSKFGLARLLGLEGGIFSKGPMLIILLHVVFYLALYGALNRRRHRPDQFNLRAGRAYIGGRILLRFLGPFLCLCLKMA